METIVTLIIWVLMAWWGYSVAEKNGRNEKIAAIVCFFFGIFGVIGYYIAGKKKETNTSE